MIDPKLVEKRGVQIVDMHDILGVASLREAGVLQDFAALRSRVRDNAPHFLSLPDAGLVGVSA